MGGLFPVLDANLVLARAEGGHALLRLTGSYRPPLDGMGEELDRIVLNRVATGTIRSLLTRIAAVLEAGTGQADGEVTEAPRS